MEFKKGSFYELCSFLYILDINGLSQDPGGRRMYKKSAFYTYASPLKYSIFGKIMLLCVCTCIL